MSTAVKCKKWQKHDNMSLKALQVAGQLFRIACPVNSYVHQYYLLLEWLSGKHQMKFWLMSFTKIRIIKALFLSEVE